MEDGCGAKGGWFNPPEFFFEASCNQHDFYYWRGGFESDRLIADKAFYKFMLKDSERAESYLTRKSHRLCAYLYYKAVRWFGKDSFNFGEMKTAVDLPFAT